MLKKIKICFGLVFSLVGVFFFSTVFAAQALPTGGNGFETATKIEAGVYHG